MIDYLAQVPTAIGVDLSPIFAFFREVGPYGFFAFIVGLMALINSRSNASRQTHEQKMAAFVAQTAKDNQKTAEDNQRKLDALKDEMLADARKREKELLDQIAAVNDQLTQVKTEFEQYKLEMSSVIEEKDARLKERQERIDQLLTELKQAQDQLLELQKEVKDLNRDNTALGQREIDLGNQITALERKVEAYEIQLRSLRGETEPAPALVGVTDETKAGDV